MRGSICPRVTAAFILFLLILESATFAFPITPVPSWGKVPEVFRAGDPGEKMLVAPLYRLAPLHVYDEVLLMIPENSREYYLAEAMNCYLSTYSWRKMVNGYTGFIPQSYLKMVLELEGFPSKRALRLLRSSGIEQIIWDQNRGGILKPPLVEEIDLVREDKGYQLWQLAPAPQVPASSDLNYKLLAPSAAPAQGFITTGLMITNPHDSAFFAPPSKIRCLMEWVGEGYSSSPVQLELDLPIFIDSKESISLRFPVRVPGEGKWRLRARVNILHTVKDLVSDPVYVFDHVPDSRDMEFLAGSIRCDKQDLVTNPRAMISIDSSVSNQGPSLWLAHSPETAGTMLVLARWYREGREVWEAQGSHLPCDLGPNQQALTPLLLRAPAEEGDYEVRLDILDDGLGIITHQPVTIRIKVSSQLD